ncbi:MAG: hypothetical protein ACT4OJ_16045 [Bacteroidota bacterium]
MRILICFFMLLTIGCGQGSSDKKEPATGDSVKPASDSLSNSNGGSKNVSDSMPRTTPTAAETAINGLLKEKFGETLLVVNDKTANWPKDVFDYFIAPQRKEYPDYPYIANGDFNGDGQQDAAVLVKTEGKSEYQVAIIFGSPLDKHRISFWKEDIDLCAVAAYPKGELEGIEAGKVKMKGDGINVHYYETASFVIYWDGKGFKRVYTSD